MTGVGEPTRVVARLPATVTSPIASGRPHRFAVANEKLRFFDESGAACEPVRIGTS